MTCVDSEISMFDDSSHAEGNTSGYLSFNSQSTTIHIPVCSGNSLSQVAQTVQHSNRCLRASRGERASRSIQSVTYSVRNAMEYLQQLFYLIVLPRVGILEEIVLRYRLNPETMARLKGKSIAIHTLVWFVSVPTV